VKKYDQDKVAQVLVALMVPAMGLSVMATSISNPQWLQLTFQIVSVVAMLTIAFALLRIVRRRRSDQS
jgi:protein-S-isoprenylcysteine O-methyltransferase Ste14